MDNVVTKQLVQEIEKLKIGDYSSYQNFYSQTSRALYQTVWNSIQDQNIANEIINDLYTNIYATIGTELTDNSQFYNWAENKARTITTTYLTTHNIVGVNGNSNNERKAEDAAVITAANAGINSMGSTAGVSTAGVGAVGIDAAAGGAAQAGVGSAAGGVAQAGMDAMAGGINQAGMGQAGMSQLGMSAANASGTVGSTGVAGASVVASSGVSVGAGNVAGAVAGAAAKTGLSIGAKIAIFAGVAVALVGAGVGAFFAVNSKKDKENTTEIVSEALSTDEIIPSGGKEDSTEEITEEVVENLETDKAERYAAYYDIVKTYMQDYPYQPVFQDENTGFLYAKLVDFNHEDKEQLIIAYSEAGTDAWYDVTYTVKIFDYANGQATEVTTINTSKIGFSEEEGSIALWTTEGPSHWSVNDLPESYKVIKTMYKYEGGSFVANHTYIEEVIIKDDYSFEVESETGYVDNEVRPVDEVRALISSIDERSDNYEFNTIIEANAKPLLTKHATMDLLAEVSGDAEFVNAVSDVEASVEADGPNYTYTYSANKYNESYALAEYSPNSAPETSADFMTVRSHCVSTRMELIEDGDVCYTFYHDVLLVTGYKDYRTDTYYWADEEAYLKHLIYPMNDDSNIVTVDEYNANVQALIN